MEHGIKSSTSKGNWKISKQKRVYFLFLFLYSILDQTVLCGEMCEADIFWKSHHPVKGSWVAILESMTFSSNDYIFTGIWFDGIKRVRTLLSSKVIWPRHALGSSSARWGLLTPTSHCKDSMNDKGWKVTDKLQALFLDHPVRNRRVRCYISHILK